MPDPRLPDITVEVRGRWGGKDVVRLAVLEYAEAALRFSGGGDDLRVPWDVLDDATWTRGVLTLYAAPDALRVTAREDLHGALGAVWARLIEHAGAVPEVARGLRDIGRPRSGVAAHHDLLIAPLIAARRRLVPTDTVERRAAAFDARGVSQRVKAVALEIALARYPDDAARRRGQEAHLEEAIEAMLRALDALEVQTTVVRECADGRRLAEWREWLRVLRRVFVESERAWRMVALGTGGGKAVGDVGRLAPE
jgi:hypothetical protein